MTHFQPNGLGFDDFIKEFSQFPESNPGPVIKLDKNGKVLISNSVAKNLFKKEITGKNICDLCPKFKKNEIKEFLKRDDISEKEIKIGSRYFIFSIRPKSKNGTIFLFGADISKRKKIEKELEKYKEKLEILVEKRTRELEKSEKKWHLLFKSLPGGSFIVNKDKIIEEVNDAFCNITEFKRDEVIGKNCSLICPNDPNKCIGFKSKPEDIKNKKDFIRAKNGKLVPIIKSLVRLNSEKEDIVIENFIDISDQKKAEERLALYKQIVKKANDAIAIIDPNGKYIEQNEAHDSLIGYSGKDLKNKTPEIHLGAKKFEQIKNELTKKGTFRGDVKSKTKDGREIDIDLSSFLIFDDKKRISCCVGIKRDITEKKKAEMKLFDSYKHLGVLNRQMSILTSLIKKCGEKTKKEVFNIILQSAIEISRCKKAYLYKFDEKLKELSHIISMSNDLKTKKSKRKFTCNELRPLCKLIKTNEIIRLNKRESLFKSISDSESAEVVYIIPISNKNKVHALIVLELEENNLISQDLAIYEAFSLHCYFALRNANLI